ncbi:MAG: transcription antitermination factor NusB [Bacteroidetes bacterium]|nr:transcription antitermination factor NusB [Bacteroidota bacterium]
MLNRRYLRVKVMQALYAFFQSDNKDRGKGEKELLNSIEKIYDLYVYLLLLLIEIRDQAERITADARNKRLPTESDLNPSTLFIDNAVVKQLSENSRLKKEVTNRKITWQTDDELVRKILTTIKNSQEYQQYMNGGEHSYETDKQFILAIYKNCITDFELLEHYFEEKSIYWVDDLRLAHNGVLKTIEGLSSSANDFALMPLYKDEAEDKQFVIDLFRKTILHEKDSEQVISEKTKNWEVERIAMMDILLMKMAITEILHFESIPVKVSLNEYIEISKLYSSPKSKMFINGILDKLVQDFKRDSKLVKTGRGLME